MSRFFFDASVVMLDLALFGLLAAICLAVYTVFKVKRDVMRNAKRIYERPTRGVKNLTVMGKGIYQQEAVRVLHIIDTGKQTAVIVSETAIELVEAVRALNNDDVRTLLESARTAAKWAEIIANFARSMAKQSAAQG